MPGKNVGQRIKMLVDRVDSVNPSLTMVEGFKQFFDYVPMDAEREHARRMEAVLLQLDLAEVQLAKDNFPEQLFRRQFGKLREAFRTSLMHQPFSHVRSNVDESVRLCLDWVAFALPDEGEVLDTTNAKLLATQLDELLKNPALADLPPSLRDLFSVHLRAILDALGMVDIEGSVPLQKAVKVAATDLVVHAEEIDAYATTAPVNQASYLKKCGAKLKQVMDAAAQGGKGVEGVDKMIKFVSERGPQAIDFVKDIAQQLGS